MRSTEAKVPFTGAINNSHFPPPRFRYSPRDFLHGMVSPSLIKRHLWRGETFSPQEGKVGGLFTGAATQQRLPRCMVSVVNHRDLLNYLYSVLGHQIYFVDTVMAKVLHCTLRVIETFGKIRFDAYER